MRITLEQLKKSKDSVVELMEIVSLEGQSYIVRLTVNGKQRLLSNEQGATWQFRSSWQAQDTLSSLQIHETHVVHASAYNEMVGMEPSNAEPLRIRLQRQTS